LVKLTAFSCPPRWRGQEKDRYVLRYFSKHGFQDVTLTLLILEPGSSFEMAVELEQYCMDMLSPKLNVDMVASSSGYHEPMSEEWLTRTKPRPLP
jgi:hypothetical protein